MVAAAFAIGVCTGLRCMTPICVLSLMRVVPGGVFAEMLYWPGHSVVFVAAGIGELIGDKLPNCPSRLEPLGLISRILFGGFCGAAISSVSVGGPVLAGAPILAGIVFGAVGVVGAVAGAFAGNRFRMRVPDGWKWPAALAEDLVAVGGSVLIVSCLR